MYGHDVERKEVEVNFEKKCRNIYRSKQGINAIPFETFSAWYAQKKHCVYCGLTEEESEILYNEYPQATRGGKRGKRLELDRKEPFLGYGENIDNLVLACYWCNNAKTNYFSYNEFLKIGPVIGAINKERIKAIKEKTEKL